MCKTSFSGPIPTSSFTQKLSLKFNFNDEATQSVLQDRTCYFQQHAVHANITDTSDSAVQYFHKYIC